MSDNTSNARVRPEWDEYFIKIAKVTSERSACERLQVGCVLVKDNRIVSQGYNGFLPGCRTNLLCEMVTNKRLCTPSKMLADCAKRGAACGGTTAYITHYPCIICTRMLLAAGIS